MPTPLQAIASALASDLLDVDVGDVDPELRATTTAFVAGRMARAGSVTRFGLGVGAIALTAWTRVRTGRPYGALRPEARRAWAARLGTTSLPLVGDYVRVVRSLVLVHVFEARAGR